MRSATLLHELLEARDLGSERGGIDFPRFQLGLGRATGWRRHRFLDVCATANLAGTRYNPFMPRLRRFYDANHLHYVTTSTYRRTRVFDSDRFKRKFITSLAHLRAELGFPIIGYVLMPEHCHWLLWPSESEDHS